LCLNQCTFHFIDIKLWGIFTLPPLRITWRLLNTGIIAGTLIYLNAATIWITLKQQMMYHKCSQEKSYSGFLSIQNEKTSHPHDRFGLKGWSYFPFAFCYIVHLFEGWCPLVHQQSAFYMASSIFSLLKWYSSFIHGSQTRQWLISIDPCRE